MKSGDFPVSQFLVFTYSTKRNAPYIDRECSTLTAIQGPGYAREHESWWTFSVLDQWGVVVFDVDPKYGTKLENILARKRE